MKALGSRLSALGLLWVAAPLAAQDTHTYRPGIDVTDYAITLEIPDTGTVIQGDVIVTAKRTARVDTLVLDLWHLRVSRVLLDDKAVQFGRTDSTILVPLPRGADGTFRVRVAYAGAVSDGLIARADTAGRWTYFGDNWPNRARYWIPSVDHPSDKATVTWTIRTPRRRGRVVVANGYLVETFGARGPTAVSTVRWRESKPIPTYLMVVAAAPLIAMELGESACGLSEYRRCVRQTAYVAPEQWGVLPGNFARANDIVQFYASTIGPFPYEKLAHLQSSTRYGGMENASAIFYNDRAFRRGGVGEGLIAHEVAHQWFGNSATAREWPHVWLSEGFATYFAALWAERSRGDTALKAEMRRIRQQVVDDTAAVLRRPVIDTVETTLTRLLNRNSYEKGAFVLHMLRAHVGDSAFFRGVRDYYRVHKHGTALTGDLQAALEKASGKRLESIMHQWLRRPGYPELEVSWRADSASGTLEIGVLQAARFGAFEFPLELAVTDRSGQAKRLDVAIPAQPETRIMLPVRGVITGVEFDPDVRLLARFTVRR